MPVGFEFLGSGKMWTRLWVELTS